MKRPFVLGLTGSVGMGKSTTADMFRDMGIPVWNADAVVHALYEPGQPGARAVATLCPDAIDEEGRVDRARLRAWVRETDDALAALDAAIHPLVQADRAAFIDRMAREGHDIVVLDIPLLFETGAEKEADAIAVVSAPAEVQRARVLARPGMTEADFERILARQMPDADKRARADYVIPTTDMDTTRKAVEDILRDIRARLRKERS
ncbi:MAG: dephospho-CoA kinase [Alphaproteobacteria bacterium]|nr:MAG: dephospho-CoA kinase [Alphaproteobacteria bacterium]